VFCLIYSAVWYLALALYNGALLLCRYYAFDVNGDGSIGDRIGSVMTFASVLMSVAILYSTLSGDFKLKSTSAIIISGIYTVFSFLRLVVNSLILREESTVLYSVLGRLRILSFLNSFHAFFLQMINVLSIDNDTKNLFSFFSAFFCAYLMLTTIPHGDKSELY
jgi:hypothetical protein